MSLREAAELGDDYVGTEHLLLSLLREQGSVAANVLMSLGVDWIRFRKRAVDLRSERGDENSIRPEVPKNSTRVRVRAVGTGSSTVVWNSAPFADGRRSATCDHL